jgi:broad specificity phosphatase PhoE
MSAIEFSKLFSNLQSPINLYFVRHGESEGNSSGRIQGPLDSPLSELGKSHAKAAGIWLKEHLEDSQPFIYTSPLSRAAVTAKIIAEELGEDPKGIEAVDDLKELNTGAFTGKTFKELEKEDPELFAKFKQESWQAVPDAESIESLCHRALNHWKRIAQKGQEIHKSIISVGHWGIMQWIFKMTLQDHWNSWAPILYLENCAIFHLEVRPTGNGKTMELWKHINHRPY